MMFRRSRTKRCRIRVGGKTLWLRSFVGTAQDDGALGVEIDLNLDRYQPEAGWRECRNRRKT